jgi:hypothetical protein
VEPGNEKIKGVLCMSFLEEILEESRKHVCAALGMTELLKVSPRERERIAEVQS